MTTGYFHNLLALAANSRHRGRAVRRGSKAHHTPKYTAPNDEHWVTAQLQLSCESILPSFILEADAMVKPWLQPKTGIDLSIT